MKIGSLFSGIGGIEYGLERSGLATSHEWMIEMDKFCCSVLEKNFPNALVINDKVENINPLDLSRVDILTAGFPCQPVSTAGSRKGVEDERWLWDEVWRFIDVLRPQYFILENVPGLFTANKGKAFERVIKDIAKSRCYRFEWQIISARSVGAAHLRKRFFGVGTLGDTEHNGLLEPTNRQGTRERTIQRRQGEEVKEKVNRKSTRESQDNSVLNTESKSSNETDKQTSSLSESREARVDIGDGHGGEESEIDWEKITQQVGLPSNGFSPGLAGRLGLPNYWTYNRDLMWRTPTTMDSKSGEDALKYATKLLQGKTHRASGQPVQITLADQIAIDQIHKNPDLFEKYKDHEIYKRPNLPPQKTFVKYLKDNVTRSTLYDALDVKKTTIDHWFRNDKYFSYPSMEDWEKLKPYLKVIKYDEEMTTIESFEWQKQKWQTPLVTSSRPSTKRIAEGINPKGNLAENPDVYKDEYIIEPWETVPRTIEDEEKRVDKIKALGNAVVPACAEFIGICISNAIKFKTIVFDADMLEDW